VKHHRVPIFSSPFDFKMETEANDLVSAACLLATKCAQEQEKEDAKAYLISVIAAILEEAVQLNDSTQVIARNCP
jgi:methionine synthase I (cobalamin-dependent)